MNAPDPHTEFISLCVRIADGACGLGHAGNVDPLGAGADDSIGATAAKPAPTAIGTGAGLSHGISGRHETVGVPD